jgi:hypothetical protein
VVRLLRAVDAELALRQHVDSQRRKQLPDFADLAGVARGQHQALHWRKNVVCP